MLGKLTNELNDRAAATDETGYLFEPFFSWLPPTVQTTAINTIAAFSFGSRAAAATGAAPVPGR